MHRRHTRTRCVLLLALALMLTLGACELADSPDGDPSAAQRSEDTADDGIEPAADETPAEVATESPETPAAESGDETGQDAADEDGTAADRSDVIDVDMTEFAYEPDTIELTAGEPTVLRFTNTGEIEHEAMIGTAHMQQEFAASDGHGDHGDGGDGGHHGDVMAVTVAPGETAELEVLIDEPGTWYIGCHLEGHYEAGMDAVIHVTD